MHRPLIRCGALLLLLSSAIATAASDEWAHLDQQASDLFRSGDYGAATALAAQALALAERDSASAPAKARQASSLNLLALIHQAQQHDEAAEALLVRAVAIAEAALPADHPNLVALRHNLASLRAERQAKSSAEQARQTEAINEQALAHRQRGEYAQAAALYRRVLPRVESLFGADSIEAARVLCGLADAQLAQQQYEAAEPYYQRASAIFENRADAAAEHADVLNSLASIRYRQRRYGDAQAGFDEALAVLERARGPQHVDLLPVLDNLFALYLATDRKEQAQLVRRRASAIRKANHV